MLRKTFWILLAVCLGSGTAQALHLDIGDYLNAEAGMFIDLPVTVGNMSGLDVRAFSIEVTYDPTYFIFDSIDESTYDYGSWWIDSNLLAPGLVRVVANGQPDAITAPGTLFNLRLYVKDTVVPEAVYTVGFDDVIFNDGSIPITTGTGNVSIAPLVCHTIEGHVWAKNTGCADCDYNCGNTGLGGITVKLYDTQCEPCNPGDLVTKTVTDSDGKYSFCVENIGDYRIVIEDPICYENDLSAYAELVPAIDGYDLLMLQRYMLGMGVYLSYCPTMTSCLPVPLFPQMIAADTDFDDRITPYDLHTLWLVQSNVMSSGYNAFPEGQWCWIFLCDRLDVSVTEVPGETTGQDFHAVLPGDVNGSFGVAEESAKTTGTVLAAPRIDGISETAQATIVVQNATAMKSIQFLMHYDPEVLRVDNVRLGADASACQLFYNNEIPGELIVTVLSSLYDITDSSCELLDFDATLLHPELEGQRSDLTFTSHRIDMTIPAVRSGYVTNGTVANEDLSMSQLKASFR